MFTKSFKIKNTFPFMTSFNNGHLNNETNEKCWWNLVKRMITDDEINSAPVNLNIKNDAQPVISGFNMHKNEITERIVKNNKKATFDENQNKTHLYHTRYSDYFEDVQIQQKNIFKEEVEFLSDNLKEQHLLETLKQEKTDEDANFIVKEKQTNFLTDNLCTLDTSEPRIIIQEMISKKNEEKQKAEDIKEQNYYLKIKTENNFYKNLNVFKKMLNEKIVNFTMPKEKKTSTSSLSNKLENINILKNNKQMKLNGGKKLSFENDSTILKRKPCNSVLQKNPFMVFDKFSKKPLREYEYDDLKKEMFNKPN